MKTHLMSNSSFYGKYKNIDRRCNSSYASSYKYYGGRGIKNIRVSFENFRDVIDSEEKEVNSWLKRMLLKLK